MLERVFVSVLNMSLIGSYAIVFVLVARLLLKKAPTIFSYALWGIVLFRLLCPFSFESVVSLIPTGEISIPQDIIYSPAPQINTGISSLDNMVNPLLPVPNTFGNSVNPIQIWLFVGAVVWALGILAMLIYSIAAFVQLKRSLIGAVPLKENIYLADHISSPFALGLWKPKIYLPSSLSGSEKDFIIAHELCHLKRFDHATRILGFAALVVHWFNPFVWVAFIASGKDMELSADEAVMQKMDRDIRREYSQSLLRFGTAKSMIHATPLAFGEGDTKSRVKNVLNYQKPAFWVIAIAIIAAVGIGVGLAANQTSDPILTPESSEVTSISVEQISGGESLGVVETTDKTQIEMLLKALQNTDKTMQGSVNDSPKRDNYFQIGINASPSRRFYLYHDGEEYFAEEPYVGIYRASREASLSAAKIYTANGGADTENASELWAMRPMIMVDGILYLDTGKEVAGNVDDSAVLGQITSVVDASKKPAEHGQCNFENGMNAKYAACEEGMAVFLENKWFFFEKEQGDTIIAEYSITKFGKNGEVPAGHSLNNQELAQAIVMNALAKSAAWEGADINTMEEYYLIRQSFPEAQETHDYYAYLLTDGTSALQPGTPVLQAGANGMYTALSEELYEQLAALFDPAQNLSFWVKPDESPQVIGNAAAEIWLRSFMAENTPAESRISKYTITDVTVIAGEPKAGVKWDEMAYQYVVQLTYDITTASDQYSAAGDGISGKGSFEGLFRELYVKEKLDNGGGFQIVAASTGGGEQEFASQSE